jgi:putative ABC transport system ATP-binding protein
MTDPTPASHAGSDPIITARSLGKTYDMGQSQVVGLRDAELDVGSGEIVVLKGASGSGKSTLLSLLGGLDRPTSGSLTIAGVDLTRANGHKLDAFRRSVVGMVFQAFNLLPTLTVLENAALPGLLAGEAEAAVRERARDLLQQLGLGHRLGHTPSRLSGGELQRTAIARALINDPAVILADEPTGNLDSTSGQAVVELLVGIGRGQGRTVLIATHADLADDRADRILRIADGRLEA